MFWRSAPDGALPPGRLIRLWLDLVLRPRRGVAAVVDAAPRLRSLAGGLLALGLVRGAVEGLWLYLAQGRAGDLPAALGRPEWYLRLGGPFLAVNAASAVFLWLTTAWILHGFGRLLGGTGQVRPLARVAGVLMVWYPLIGALNYLYLWLPLPAVSLRASTFYQPLLGAGQLLALASLAVTGYRALRDVHRLPRTEAALVAGLPVLISLGLYAGSAAVLFRVVFRLLPVPADQALHLGNLAYLATAGLISAGLAWLLQRQGGEAA